MNITLKNLGPIKEADFSIGDMTIICGQNNTGKTYLTYVVYGFLNHWHKSRSQGVDRELVDRLIVEDIIDYPISEIERYTASFLDDSISHFITKLPNIFANTKVGEGDTTLSISSELKRSTTLRYLSLHMSLHMIGLPVGSDNEIEIEVHGGKDKDHVNLVIRRPPDRDIFFDNKESVEICLNSIFRSYLFGNSIPKPFIASAERTGASLFQREVDFTRSKVVDLLKETNINPKELLDRFTADYPMPVKHNIDFVRDLPNIIKKESAFAKKHPEILQAFSDILGGDYSINQTGGVEFTPSDSPELNLSLAESSSTVRSLVSIGFYLRHTAEEGDLLMVDEPELNLHPQNQRKVARLFAMLVNHGIRVFITTHSDYIIRELNTLLLLNKSDDERLQELMQREGYDKHELLKPEQLNVYMTTEDKAEGGYTLIPADISPENGIALSSFDDTIEEVNRIQDEIVWG